MIYLLYMKFEIDKETLEQINTWKNSLPESSTGAIGGRFTYSFTETSVGTIIKVKDNSSGIERDFTDYSDW